MKEIEIYNRITLNINKEMLDHLIQLVEKDKEQLEEHMIMLSISQKKKLKVQEIMQYEERELKMLEDLYSILVVQCSKFSTEEIAEEKIFNKSFEIKDEDKVEKYCPKCDRKLEIEKEKEIDYPYVCKGCDENLYEFETKNK